MAVTLLESIFWGCWLSVIGYIVLYYQQPITDNPQPTTQYRAKAKKGSL